MYVNSKIRIPFKHQLLLNFRVLVFTNIFVVACGFFFSFALNFAPIGGH